MEGNLEVIGKEGISPGKNMVSKNNKGIIYIYIHTHICVYVCLFKIRTTPKTNKRKN